LQSSSTRISFSMSWFSPLGLEPQVNLTLRSAAFGSQHEAARHCAATRMTTRFAADQHVRHIHVANSSCTFTALTSRRRS
jgi:hypothetical protein